MSLDDLIPGCTEHQRATRIYRRKQRIAVFKAVFEVCKGLAQFIDEPIEFVFLLGAM